MNIQIGTNVFTKQPVYFEERGTWNIINILGMPRISWKTTKAMTLITTISKTRPCLVFDYANEYHNMLRPNMTATNPDYVKNCVIIDDLGMEVSEMNKKEDWDGLGFPPETSRMLAKMAEKTEAHNNDPLEFRRMLLKLPETSKGVGPYNEEFNLDEETKLYAPVNKAVKEAILNRLDVIKNLFLGKNKIENWLSLLENHDCVIVNLQLQGQQDYGVARAKVGKILEKMMQEEKRFMQIRPAIFFEEADTLAPRLTETDSVPSSNFWMRRYVSKLQKFHAECFFITQRLEQLDQQLTQAHHYIVGKTLGMLPPQLYEAVQKLREWEGKQESLYWNLLDDTMQVFIPTEIPCQHQGYSNDIDSAPLMEKDILDVLLEVKENE